MAATHFMDKFAAFCRTFTADWTVMKVSKDGDRIEALTKLWSESGFEQAYAVMFPKERNALRNLVEFEYAHRGDSWIQQSLDGEEGATQG